MIPWLRGAWRALLTDPQLARRVVRGLLLGFALATPGLVALLPDRWALKVVAYLAGGLAGVVGGMVSGSTQAPKIGAPQDPAP